mgnify:CR=1 FL=1
MAEDRPKPAIVEPEVEERSERAEPPQKRLGLEEPGVDAPDGGFDLVLANIVADVIIALAPAIMSHLRSGGCLVASGVILPRREEVIAALESAGLIVTDAREQEGWCALLMQKA